MPSFLKPFTTTLWIFNAASHIPHLVHTRQLPSIPARRTRTRLVLSTNRFRMIVSGNSLVHTHLLFQVDVWGTRSKEDRAPCPPLRLTLISGEPACGGGCSQGGVEIPTGGEWVARFALIHKPASASSVWLWPGVRGSSRSGVIPEPTVIVRMKEDAAQRNGGLWPSSPDVPVSRSPDSRHQPLPDRKTRHESDQFLPA